MDMLDPVNLYLERVMAGFDFGTMLPLVLIFVVMYFLIIRPQNKKAKQHRELIASLGKGTRVIMNGGVIGTITKVLDTELVLEISKGVEMHVARPMVATILTEEKEKKSVANKAAPKKKAVKK